MARTVRMHIFRPGTFRSRGIDHAFSESDVAAIAAAYDPAKHEAPIVVGHPRDDTPAYGWVGALAADGAGLHATPREVSPAFAEAVQEGRYKKVSAAFYHPDNAANPTPGAWYLRHVGFLGGQPPVVKGLTPIQFADDGADCVAFEVEFSESAYAYATRSIAGLFRGIREWIISREGTEAADKAVPDYEIDFLARAADEDSSPSPSFSEPAGSQSSEEDTVTDAEKAAQAERERTLAAREAAITAREAGLAESAATAMRRDSAEFAERLVTEGRILPRDRDAVASLLMAVPEDVEVTFAEGDATVAKPGPARTFARDFLARLPVQVDFSERSGAGAAAIAPLAPTIHFDMPRGMSLDADSAELHKKTVAFAEEHNVSYEAALTRVSATTTGAAT